MTQPPTLYDQNSYYDSDGLASRLAPSLDPLLHALDWEKARSAVRAFTRHTGKRVGASSGLRVLDIGAGDGKFLYFMRRFGFTPSGTTASEISQKAAMAKFGIELEHTTEIPENLRANKFDVITYWHVFEHLEDPAAHIAACQQILAPGGLIIIEVPNPESIGARLSFNAWLGSDVVHHINPMTATEIETLVERHGLKVVGREDFSLKFTYPFLWSALLGATFGNKTYDFDSVFGTLKNPIGRLRSTPFATLNALASTVYLAPAIGVCALAGLASRRGEVFRLYIQSASR